MQQSTVRQLTCQKCGAAFTCGTGGQNGNCWCCDEAYRVPMPPDGTDCLCPACLRVHAKSLGMDIQQ